MEITAPVSRFIIVIATTTKLSVSSPYGTLPSSKSS